MLTSFGQNHNTTRWSVYSALPTDKAVRVYSSLTRLLALNALAERLRRGVGVSLQFMPSFAAAINSEPNTHRQKLQ